MFRAVRILAGRSRVRMRLLRAGTRWRAVLAIGAFVTVRILSPGLVIASLFVCLGSILVFSSR